MKISASIYSAGDRDLRSVIQDLEEHHVDLLHVDCNDDPAVFEDIRKIREWTKIPIDLHLITDRPEFYFPLLRDCPVDYLTFQYESLKEPLKIPSDIQGRKGLAIITPTDVEVFDAYANFDFILIMATIPGQSGGVFDSENFNKIRAFKKKYPAKSIHVDGGVNGEVSFILRNMGVSASVSGSYMFKAPSIGHALMNLTVRNIDSHYHVSDFMVPLEECPRVVSDNMTFLKVLESIERGQLGFTLVIDQQGKLEGIISNADVRKALLRIDADADRLAELEFVNRNALSVNENSTVYEMLELIKRASFPVMYLPVVDEVGKASGIVTFVNLIKGEI
ncbi:MAG: CBS domain-containing protein [Bacteroidetes bacterium]|nr:MAG: CBS domain-containing protein [Bacteroidota bacterium]